MKRPRCYHKVILFACALPCLSAQASDVPDDFLELFDYKDRMVSLRDLNGQDKVSVRLEVNYDSVRLPAHSEESKAVLAQYFQRNQVSEPLAQKILAELGSGVSNTDQCKGRVDECVVLPEEYAFYYDYDSALLHLFINGAYLDRPSTEVEYASGHDRHNGLINHADLYTNHYDGGNSSLTWNDTAIVGLPYGHLTGDFSVTDNGNESLYELSYDVAWNRYRAYMGRFNQGVKLNSTDLLNPTRYVEQSSVNLATSRALRLGQAGSTERLYFFSPARGELRVVRDGRIIKNFSVAEGQGYITYADLPSGRYDVTLELLVGGQVVSSELRTIYNQRHDFPDVGEMDLALSAGVFEAPRGSLTLEWEDEGEFRPLHSRYNDSGFASALASYRISGGALLAAGALASRDESMVTLGGALQLPFSSELSGHIDYYQHGGKASDTSFSGPGFSLGYEQIKHGDSNRHDTLLGYLMGYRDYTRRYVNLYHSLPYGITLFGNYSRGQYEERFERGNYDYELLSVGLGMPLPGASRLDVSYDQDLDSRDRSIFLTWQIPLGGAWSARYSWGRHNQQGKEIRASVMRDFTSEDQSTSGFIDAGGVRTYDRLTEGEVYAGLSTSQPAYQGSLNTHANSNGSRGLSASLSSSQLVTGSGVEWVGQKADSYAVVNADIQDQQIQPGEDNPLGFISTRRNKRLEGKRYMYGAKEIIALRPFDEYSVAIDSESVSMFNTGDHGVDAFAYPGSVIQLKPSLRPVVTFVSAFSDLFDQPVDELECQGIGCIDVAKVVDGVFRVSLIEGSDFSLFAGQARCLVPRDYEEAEQLNFGQNYCLPQAKPKTFVKVAHPGNKTLTSLYYLGTFDGSASVHELVNKIKGIGAVHQRSIGRYMALYLEIQEGTTLSRQDEALLQNIGLYAKEMEVLQKISQPIVKQ